MVIVLELVDLPIKDILIVLEASGKPVMGEKITVEEELEIGTSNWILERKTDFETMVPVA